MSKSTVEGLVYRKTNLSQMAKAVWRHSPAHEPEALRHVPVTDALQTKSRLSVRRDRRGLDGKFSVGLQGRRVKGGSGTRYCELGQARKVRKDESEGGFPMHMNIRAVR
ncbi:hypothetical protein K0M31_007098 [Melipona bicolor]|uniref:Uncharacterized protein n=1 Tax=Melipona bicolor TaxID=60889 RepID=A0AA40KKV3_9HYME|nr:hypothetical protein K0M31_007098 [Melipona bicolor]